jgi:hypothetical protein
MACPANSNQTCGGALALDVYEVVDKYWDVPGEHLSDLVILSSQVQAGCQQHTGSATRQTSDKLGKNSLGLPADTASRLHQGPQG